MKIPVPALVCAALLLSLSPAAHAGDDIPGGHVYLGLGIDGFALLNAPYRLRSDGSTARAGTLGVDLSARVDVELQRALFGTFLTLGANARFGRAALGLTAGYVLTEGAVGLYVAGGAGLYSTTFPAFDDSGTGGPAGIAEVGVRLPRSWQFGRAAFALSSWLPAFSYKGAWTPSLQLGLRFEL